MTLMWPTVNNLNQVYFGLLLGGMALYDSNDHRAHITSLLMHCSHFFKLVTLTVYIFSFFRLQADVVKSTPTSEDLYYVGDTESCENHIILANCFWNIQPSGFEVR